MWKYFRYKNDDIFNSIQFNIFTFNRDQKDVLCGQCLAVVATAWQLLKSSFIRVSFFQYCAVLMLRYYIKVHLDFRSSRSGIIFFSIQSNLISVHVSRFSSISSYKDTAVQPIISQLDLISNFLLSGRNQRSLWAWFQWTFNNSLFSLMECFLFL